MIKYINDGEIRTIRRGYYLTLLLKILSLYDIDKFINLNETLERAIKIFKLLRLLKLENYIANESNIMLNYLLKYNLINSEKYEGIKTYFINDYPEDIHDEVDPDFYYDYFEEREEILIKLINSICNDLNLNYAIDYSSRIFKGLDIDENIFGCIKRELRSPEESSNKNYYKDMSEEELEDEYFMSYVNDSIVIGIENFDISRDSYEILHDILPNGYDTIIETVFFLDGNTYFQFTTECQEALDYSCIIMIILTIRKLI